MATVRRPEIRLRAGDPGLYGSCSAPHGHVTIHFGGRADSCEFGLHVWGDGVADDARTDWDRPRSPDGADDYGPYWTLPVGDPAAPITFVVHRAGEKDPDADLCVRPQVMCEGWVRSGEPVVYPTRAAAENRAVVHYQRPDGDYDGWGLHAWTGAAEPTTWEQPLAPTWFDGFGAAFRVPLAAGATQLAYVLHHGDRKDLLTDQCLDVATVGHEVWVRAADERYHLPLALTDAPAVDLAESWAVWVDRDTVAVRTTVEECELRYDPAGKLSIVDGELIGGQSLRLRLAGALRPELRTSHPHLWQYTAFRVHREDRHLVPEALRSQVVFVGYDENRVVATGVQLAGALDDLYQSAVHEQLGPTFRDGRPALAVWAPSARTVELELFDTPHTMGRNLPMRRDDETGVWRASGDPTWLGKYYRYRVTAWQPAAQAVGTASVTDPYSVALAADSTHSLLVDVADPALAPPGWAVLAKPADRAWAQIYELSVRDFSIADDTVPAARRGTYLAFAQLSSAGMRHLSRLARAGVTHVHLLPVFDFAGVPDRRSDQLTPPCNLAAFPSDSPRQQECIAKVADRDGYNWGYDPYHYNAPEGSYATDPDGAARTRQLRQAVAGLSAAGLRVVLDVVYNHTAAAGTEPHSVLDQIVPGYYHRLLDDGSVATSTCCPNTAPEHLMMGKLVVDSVVFWARQYKVDGFRFDLMGHHPKANLLAVRAALNALTRERDGVDGRRILLYGEGWSFGEVANNARFEQATQTNMAGTGVGTFDDRLRDAVRGGAAFENNPRVQGFATGLYTDSNGDPVNGSAPSQRERLLRLHDVIQVGLTGNLASYMFRSSSGAVLTGADVGGYTAAPGESITYVDAHDNEILYDALAYKLPASMGATDRARMQTVALAMTVLGQGTGFVAGGSDRLRSKSLDRNSYNSGDWFNAIQWDCAVGNGFGRGLPMASQNRDKWRYARPLLANRALVPSCAVITASAARYADLLAVRSSSPVFSLETAADVQRRVAFPLAGPDAMPGVITMTLDAAGLDSRWASLVVVFNATPTEVRQRVVAFARAPMEVHPVLAASADPVVRESRFDRAAGAFVVPARTVAVFVHTPEAAA